MLSNNKFWLLGALALLSGCGHGNRLPRVADASSGPPPQYGQYGDTRYRAPAQYPSSVPTEFSGPGATYSQQTASAPQYQQPDYPQQPAAQQYPALRQPGSGYSPPAYPPKEAPAYPAPSYSSPAGAGYIPPAYGTRPDAYPPPQRQQLDYAPQQPAYAPPSGPQVLGREDRYDAVGYADWAAQAGTVAAAHRSLPIGSFVEVTALDSGRTVLVPITARSSSSREIELSGSAAQLLGFGPRGPAPVRVRRVLATGADETALRMGRPAPPRVDTPPVLLNALRHKLNGTLGQGAAMPAPAPDYAQSDASYAPPGASYTPPSVRAPVQRAPAGRPGATYAAPGASYTPPSPVRVPVARAPVRSAPVAVRAGFYVQVAALSNPGNATALARQLGAGVKQQGGLYAVRLGPYADAATAQRARDGAAQRGYGDARIVREN